MPRANRSSLLQNNFEFELPNELEEPALQLEALELITIKKRIFVRCINPLDYDQGNLSDKECSGVAYVEPLSSFNDYSIRCSLCGREIQAKMKNKYTLFRIEKHGEKIFEYIEKLLSSHGFFFSRNEDCIRVGYDSFAIIQIVDYRTKANFSADLPRIYIYTDDRVLKKKFTRRNIDWIDIIDIALDGPQFFLARLRAIVSQETRFVKNHDARRRKVRSTTEKPPEATSSTSERTTLERLGPTPRIFVHIYSEDFSACQPLIQRLTIQQREGRLQFSTMKDTLAGTRIESLSREILDSDVFIFIISTNAIADDLWNRHAEEIKQNIHLEKLIRAVRLRDTLDYEIYDFIGPQSAIFSMKEKEKDAAWNMVIQDLIKLLAELRTRKLPPIARTPQRVVQR